MTSKSKVKGNRVEREIVTLAKELGFEAKRAYASNGQSLGKSEKVDLLIGPLDIQVKAKKEFPKWLLEAQKDVDGVVFKEDRKDPVILVDLRFFLSLVIDTLGSNFK